MAQKDDTLDLHLPSDSPLSLSFPDTPSTFTPTTSTSTSGSYGSVHGLDSTPIGRGDGASPILDHDIPGPASMPDDEMVKRTVKRCSGCRKRVGLTGFRCRCGDVFCAEHRYSDRHDCPYDYKTAGRAAIARDNPVVRAAKILKL